MATARSAPLESSGGQPGDARQGTLSSSGDVYDESFESSIAEGSTVSIEGADDADLDIEYSESDLKDDEAEAGTEAGEEVEEPMAVQEHSSSLDESQSSAALGSSVPEHEAEEYELDAPALEESSLEIADLVDADSSNAQHGFASVDITDDIAQQPSMASVDQRAYNSTETLDNITEPPSAVAEDQHASASTDIMDDISEQPFAVTMGQRALASADMLVRVVEQPSAASACHDASASTGVLDDVVEQPSAASLARSASAVQVEGSQDASEMMGQTSLKEVPSLKDVPSTSSLGGGRTATSSRNVSFLQPQASTVSAATYEEDFEEGEVSEAQLGATTLVQTTLSVVEEEEEPKPEAEATGSKAYTDDFTSSAVAESGVATAEFPSAGAESATQVDPSEEGEQDTQAVPSESEEGEDTNQSVASESSNVSEGALEDVDIEYEEDVEVPESALDDQQYSSVSGGPLGPMLQHSTAGPVGMEVSQRYGPSSNDTSHGYSEDFAEAERAAEEEEAELTGKQSSEDQLAARTASLHSVTAASEVLTIAPEASKSGVQEDGHTVSAAQPSASQQLPSESSMQAMHPRSAAGPVETGSIYSVDEDQIASPRSSSGPAAAPSPPAGKEAILTEPSLAPAPEASKASTAVDPVQHEASLAYSEAQGDDDYTRDFPASDSFVAAGPEREPSGEYSDAAAPAPPAHKSNDVSSHPISQAPSTHTLSANDADGVSVVGTLSGSGLADDMPEDVEYDDAQFDPDMSELGLEGPSMAKAPSAGTVALHAASKQEGQLGREVSRGEVPASEGPEPEDSATLIAVPPGRGLRQTRQIESKVWRSQQSMLEDDEEVEGQLDLVDVTAASEASGLLEMLGADLIEASEALTPSHSFRNRSGDLVGGPSSGSPFGLRPSPSSRFETIRESRDREDEEGAASSEANTPQAREAPTYFQGAGDDKFEGEEKQSSRAASKESADEVDGVDEEIIAVQSGDEDAEELFKAYTHEPQASASSAQYTDRVEAPPSDESGGQSVVEYDLYTSAALAADDSDDLAEYAAAFESQAIGDDDDDEASADMSGISASGVSDDLGKYKVVEEEPEVIGNDPFSVDENDDDDAQALLDQPDAGTDFPKGDFESEIEEMLAASRSKSRLMSPYQSREWGGESETATPEGTTPYSVSARPSLAGMSPAGMPPAHSTIVAALTSAAVASSPSASVATEATEAEGSPSSASPSRQQVVDGITDATIQELLADAVEAMIGVAGPGDSFAGASIPLASPLGSAAGIQLLPGSRHRLSQVSSLHDGSDELLEAEEARADDDEPAPAPAAEHSRVSAGGEASISMSAGDLEGDIDLEASLEEAEPAVPVKQAAFAPALAPERSDRDLALQSSDPDSAGGAGGAPLTSDEDLGWGGADEDAELEDGWQPDLSGYIAPEIDQAAIERENAPAVATNPEAVSKYVDQVLDHFMESRPEFLVPGAEPLSLEGFLAQERRLVDASEAQHIHNKMLYDAINEAIIGVYRAANRVQSNQPWTHQKRFVKPLPNPKEMEEQVQRQIRTWSGTRMREPAETDKVLAADAQEDERAWADLSAEEADVQREVAELIWAELVSDTANAVMEVEAVLTGGGAKAAVGGSRRRMGVV
ncbi:hypothetical protein GPECTOR_2g1284 [Gonium pectorale]|uniref:DUF4378 domain-containing protein n=1 Tax=Gonium pectorale TaxID=33097 RepID=A0A150H119_GONPE|nr:hypothetical protein GPECTOR_2g1284 [Gonium pectorale]|eukprot:KXZ55734.1 hypothetical protein GPECTOR_2g1284 [Gonium pectorale]